jgi:hypothetical protein
LLAEDAAGLRIHRDPIRARQVGIFAFLYFVFLFEEIHAQYIHGTETSALNNNAGETDGGALHQLWLWAEQQFACWCLL